MNWVNQIELPWVAEALKHIGITEDSKPGKHNPTILGMLDALGNFNGEAKAWWREDETPWCGVFVGFCLGVAGRFVIKEWYRAREWDNPDVMTKLSKPAYGCIVTFTRSGGGHVGFVVGINKAGNLMVLGGNQGNRVSIVPFALNRVTGYYWPSVVVDKVKSEKRIPFDIRYNLPLFNSNGEVSTNEG